LLPVKNEAWVLPSYLSSVSKIADEIIALNDGSNDSSEDILKNDGVKIIVHDFGNEKIVNMSARRQILLDAGRKAGGTHFIWLDADETFSANFIPHAKNTVGMLELGEKLRLRWVHAWKDDSRYLKDTDSPFGYIWKDFIWCDDRVSNFDNQFLSEARTPGKSKKTTDLEEKNGAVIHWQFSDWKAVQLKQAWYRCTEMIEGSRSARKINHTYSITLDNNNLKTECLPEHWVKNINKPQPKKTNFQLEEIKRYFDLKGLLFFEPLQIWHVPELRVLFVEKMGREPKNKVFPKWLVYLNTLKNKHLHA